MPQVVISPEAENDLLEIWLYIAEDSPINADRFLDKLNEKAELIAGFKEAGSSRPELGKDIQSFPVDRYVIYFREKPEGIELVRVLSGARDINILF
ncbi:MAG: type II toxin-antitoxin system RelE/ParE family toxin [Gammaproteobacteria bacterium]|nr:MAG: type II toxin-antitoxin system RelE/ParE family toxin [Gammaproteobacteria bacterium]